MQHNMVIEGFGYSGKPVLMDSAGGRVGLSRCRLLLRIRHHRQGARIGQRLDTFMRLRHLFPGQRALQGEQGFQCFLFRRVFFRQNSLQKLHRADALGIAVVMLLFTHGRA